VKPRSHVVFGLIVLPALVALLIPEATARRRRPRGKLKGRLSPKVLERPGVRLSKAYWMFGVPHLQQKRNRGSFSDYLVFLDVWDERAFRRLEDPVVETKGATFSPRLVVIPRRASTQTIVFQNRDHLQHRLTSKDHGDLKRLILPPNSRELVKLEGVLPLPVGSHTTYRLRSTQFEPMRAEIVFLRSSAYTRVGPRGTFRLRRLPRGEHTLRVYHRGQIRLKKKIEVGRRRLNLKTLKLKPAS